MRKTGLFLLSVMASFTLQAQDICLEAHRGLSNRYPENTLPSFEAAAKVPVYGGMETDVQMTSDGVLVLMHDNTLDRTTNATGKVSDYTYEELQKIIVDAGSGIEAYGQNLRIPLFEDYLDICIKARLKPYVELKLLSDEGLMKTVEMIRSKGLKDTDYVLTSFTLDYLRKVSEWVDVPLEYMKDTFTIEDIQKALDVKNLIIRPNSQKLTPEVVDWCRKLGLKMEAYGLPVGDKTLLNRLMEWGIGGVTCNDYEGLDLDYDRFSVR